MTEELKQEDSQVAENNEVVQENADAMQDVVGSLEQNAMESPLTNGLKDDEPRLVSEAKHTDFEKFAFSKQFAFQDMNDMYVIEFADGSSEEVKEESVYAIMEKFAEKEIKSIVVKSSTVHSILEGTYLQKKPSAQDADKKEGKADG